MSQIKQILIFKLSEIGQFCAYSCYNGTRQALNAGNIKRSQVFKSYQASYSGAFMASMSL
jgi:hypothetical protein